MEINDFSYRLSRFLGSYQPAERGASPHTISSYRDTFVLMLAFARDEMGICAEKLFLKDFDAGFVRDFLDWLEDNRGCTASTRNVRLAAIKSFARYLQYVEPAYMSQWQLILAIPAKKAAAHVPTYAKPDGIRLLLAQPDTSTARGRRDLALMTLMFACAARVSEVTRLTPASLRLDAPSTATIVGKGNKTRVSPLAPDEARILASYMEENGLLDSASMQRPLFFNRSGEKLTSAGVSYIVRKYAAMAHGIDPTAMPENFTCHSIRHSKAMALLEADVNIVYIRDLLGHSSVKTTEIYARVDGRRKREAIAAAYGSVLPTEDPVWTVDKGLLAWLKNFNK